MKKSEFAGIPIPYPGAEIARAWVGNKLTISVSDAIVCWHGKPDGAVLQVYEGGRWLPVGNNTTDNNCRYIHSNVETVIAVVQEYVETRITSTQAVLRSLMDARVTCKRLQTDPPKRAGEAMRGGHIVRDGVCLASKLREQALEARQEHEASAPTRTRLRKR